MALSPPEPRPYSVRWFRYPGPLRDTSRPSGAAPSAAMTVPARAISGDGYGQDIPDIAGRDVNQLSLFRPYDEAPLSGPWVRFCDDPGPYAMRRPTDKNIGRLEVLRCTRPANHPQHLHVSAEPSGRVLAAWTPAGEPRWPAIIEKGGLSASDIPV